MSSASRTGRWLRLCMCIALSIIVVSMSSLAEAKSTGRYIVLLEEPPVALYEGGVAGYAATSPRATGARKLDRTGRAAQAYAGHLTVRQDAVLAELRARTRTAIQPSHRYVLTLNGFAAELTQVQAQTAAALPGVAEVAPDEWRTLHTDAGPEWMNAPAIWENVGQDSVPYKGENVVVGIIDSGINQESPSFADVGGEGYDHDNPRGRYYGVCDPDNPVYDPQYRCNDKLIGMWSFVTGDPGAASPLDVMGHGSHTASTAAGNVVQATAQGHTATLTRTISGVAPHANIISYRGGNADGGLESWLVACIEQAVADQVDVVNYSIGGGQSDPWTDLSARAFLAAHAAGVVVAVSAGNAGPGPGTMSSPANAPWVLTVGASSHDRSMVSSLESMSGGGIPPESMQGVGFTAGYGPARIVYAGDYQNPNDTTGDTALCAAPFPADTFQGEIVVCEYGAVWRSAKSVNVQAGGAGGMVMINRESYLNSLPIDDHVLPAMYVTYDDGLVLKEWLASGAGHTASIAAGAPVEDPAFGDMVTGFSSRGPNVPIEDIIKPDVAAPGVQILAAGDTPAERYLFMSGTSMAAPHAAGAAALLAGLRPEWTPAEVHGALMTTAYGAMHLQDGVSPAGPFAMGAGRIDLARAGEPGLLFDITAQEYHDADPARGGDPAGLNLPSLGEDHCISTQHWTRTVTSDLGETETWTVSVETPGAFTMSATPEVFTLEPGQSQKLDIRLAIDDTAGTFEVGEWQFGAVALTPSSHAVAAAMPVAVRRTLMSGPSRAVFDDVRASDVGYIEGFRAVEIEQVTADVHGLGPGTLHRGELAQDPTINAIDNSAGEWRTPFMVGEGTRRLVIELVETSSQDLDLYLFREGSLVAASEAGGNAERIALETPGAGEYQLVVQNYASSDMTGASKDTAVVVIGQVPQASMENLQVRANVAGGHIPMEQPFALRLGWEVDPETRYWFGAVDLGTSPSERGNLGTVAIELEVYHDGGTPEWLQDLIDAGRPRQAPDAAGVN